MAVQDQVAEVEQQVLAMGLDAVEAAAVETLDAGGAAARVGRAGRDRLAGEGGVDAAGGAQDRVPLCHRP